MAAMIGKWLSSRPVTDLFHLLRFGLLNPPGLTLLQLGWFSNHHVRPNRLAQADIVW